MTTSMSVLCLCGVTPESRQETLPLAQDNGARIRLINGHGRQFGRSCDDTRASLRNVGLRLLLLRIRILAC